MYIRGLIPRNFAKLAEAVTIAAATCINDRNTRFSRLFSTLWHFSNNYFLFAQTIVCRCEKTCLLGFRQCEF